MTDVDAELEQIEKEQAEAMEQYGNAFVQKPDDVQGGEELNGEGEEE